MENKGFGLKLIALRQEQGFSQAELGEKLGFSQRTVSDWENGKTEPCLTVIKRLSKLFDVSLEELLEDVGD